jgi:phosphodiesterase/alkaline phosphatase D-like protein
MKKLSHSCASKMGALSVGVALLASLFSAHAAVDPMTVSAGDVNQTSAVLWAHSAVPGRVRLDFSTDPTFTTGVRSIHLREHDALVPVKALVSHLSPVTTYFYRAIGPAASASGKFWTPPRDGTFAGLRFGVSGDEHGELAPYPSVSNAAGSDLDFFLQLATTFMPTSPRPMFP